jgi:peptide/nickel transport system ATP-binding protein
LSDFSLSLSAESPTILTVAGESGSGKSTLANLVLGFLTPSLGQVLYKGHEIHQMSRKDFSRYRREVQAIFQDPYEVYNPFYHVDNIFRMVIQNFRLASNSEEARHITEQALEAVGLRPADVLGKYPHELSGGQRQRLMVARVFLLKPRLIVADEPVSMVDASLRGMILEFMLELKRELGVSFLYITHDLSTAYQFSDKIVILYQGKVVEQGNIDNVIVTPQHPYTQMLVRSIPLPDPDIRWGILDEDALADERAIDWRTGCAFRNRCVHAMPRCSESIPYPLPITDHQHVACHLYD